MDENAGDGGASRWLDIADHPLLYAIAITFIVFALGGLFYYLFLKLGWQGPASLFH